MTHYYFTGTYSVKSGCSGIGVPFTRSKKAEAENIFRLPRSGHRWVWQEEAKRKRTGNRHELKMLKMQKRKGEKEEFQKRSGSRLQKMKSTKKTAKNWVSSVQQGLGQKNGEKWGGIDSW